MDKSKFEKLHMGDIIRAKNSIKAFMVADNNGAGNITIVRIEVVNNPEEWDLIFKANLIRADE